MRELIDNKAIRINISRRQKSTNFTKKSSMNMDKRLCIECIKMFENIRFTESIEGENTIGYIDDNNRHIKVLYIEDNLGGNIALEFLAKKGDIAQYVSDRLSRRVINGRHEVCDDGIILSSVFPILDEQFLYKQIRHALLEIWAMNIVVENEP